MFLLYVNTCSLINRCRSDVFSKPKSSERRTGILLNYKGQYLMLHINHITFFRNALSNSLIVTFQTISIPIKYADQANETFILQNYFLPERILIAVTLSKMPRLRRTSMNVRTTSGLIYYRAVRRDTNNLHSTFVTAYHDINLK